MKTNPISFPEAAILEVETNLTKVAGIWVKKGQKAGFLYPTGSKIILTKGKQRRKRKSEEEERRRGKSNGCSLSVYGGTSPLRNLHSEDTTFVQGKMFTQSLYLLPPGYWRDTSFWWKVTFSESQNPVLTSLQGTPSYSKSN